MRVRSAFLVLVAVAVAAGTACSPTREEASTIPANATSSPARSPAESTETAESTEQATPSPTAAAEEQVIRVDVTNGTVTPPPAPVDVALGRTVIIEVIADADDEIHVHGYEVTAPVTAGQPARVSVAATTAGQFEVELHNDTLLLFTLRVQ